MKRKKRRVKVEHELITSGLYFQRVVKSKKVYTRKKKHRDEANDFRECEVE